MQNLKELVLRLQGQGCRFVIVGGFDECLANSEPVPIRGTEVRVLTLDAMIASKRAMGRPRDLHAALELEAIRERRGDKESR